VVSNPSPGGAFCCRFVVTSERVQGHIHALVAVLHDLGVDAKGHPLVTVAHALHDLRELSAGGKQERAARPPQVVEGQALRDRRQLVLRQLLVRGLYGQAWSSLLFDRPASSRTCLCAALPRGNNG
jgi:hypothetical protein